MPFFSRRVKADIQLEGEDDTSSKVYTTGDCITGTLNITAAHDMLIEETDIILEGTQFPNTVYYTLKPLLTIPRPIPDRSPPNHTKHPDRLAAPIPKASPDSR